MSYKSSFALLVALRNLRRKPRRTLLLILGLALANAVTIWILTFRHNAHSTMLDNLLGLKYGHQQITSPGHYDFEKRSLNPYQTFAPAPLLQKLSPDFPYSLRVQSIVLMASHENALPVNLNGYQMERERIHSKLGKVLKRDNYSSSFPLIIGKRLAEKLNVQPGDEVAVISQALDGSVANELFKVEDILDLGGGVFEANFAITTYESLQQFLVIPASQAHVLVNFSEDSLSALVSGKNLQIYNWQELVPEIATSSEFMSNFTKFYVLFFALVASLSMGNTLALSFLERLKEYRMSTIIGAPRKWLKQTMLLETIVIGLSSLLLGNIIISVVIAIFYHNPIDIGIMTKGQAFQMGGMVLTDKIKVTPQWWAYLTCNVIFAITIMLASIYPARVVLRRAEVQA